MTETQSDFLVALKKFVLIVVSIVTVIWLIVHCLSIKYLMDRIETTRREILPCKCSPIKVETSGNHTVITQRNDPAEQLAREILQSKGDIKK